MALPLEVFEERYLIMMANLLKTVQALFGVVLIGRGHQLGAARRCPENDRLAALGYFKMGNPPRGNSAYGPTAEALNCLICGRIAQAIP